MSRARSAVGKSRSGSHGQGEEAGNTGDQLDCPRLGLTICTGAWRTASCPGQGEAAAFRPAGLRAARLRGGGSLPACLGSDPLVHQVAMRAVALWVCVWACGMDIASPWASVSVHVRVGLSFRVYIGTAALCFYTRIGMLIRGSMTAYTRAVHTHTSLYLLQPCEMMPHVCVCEQLRELAGPDARVSVFLRDCLCVYTGCACVCSVQLNCICLHVCCVYGGLGCVRASV